MHNPPDNTSLPPTNPLTTKPPAGEPTVYIVDDDAAIRHSTTLLLRSAGLDTQSFASADEFVTAYSDRMHGCLILDISMPGMTGMEVIQRLRDQGAHLPIIVVSGTSNIPIAVEGMKLGVVDFLEKPVHPDTLLAKVRDAITLHGERLARRDAERHNRGRFDSLTPRERELLALLAKGMSTKQVALQLKIAVKTADNHRTKLMRKTGALNAADLVRLAMEAKLV